VKKKKDTNYIAAVEKAIAEKYGKQTVQDFRSDWSSEKEKEYLSQISDVSRTSKTRRKKHNKASSCDRTCPVCKTYSFSARDDLYMNRFDCCFQCYSDFVVYNEEDWQSGWRPDKEYIIGILRGRKDGNSTRNS
jgi:hypothetical protein